MKHHYCHWTNKKSFFCSLTVDVVQADDDTYMIMENLRRLLKEHSPTDPLYFGRRFKKTAKLEFMSGGAGYVLSKEALTRFATVQIMC